ncbi:MAG TPA: hypothetical protein ENG16_00575 [Archaeoglobus sp.]|nr:hypothetical protein [Archaeoglobus sp.]
MKVGDKVRVKRGHWRAGEVGTVDTIHKDGWVKVRFDNGDTDWLLFSEVEIVKQRSSLLKERIGD